MGILDDAIREHLDLKRRHGAPGEDVERLEKEAFGPPTRPGDPDFEGPAEDAEDSTEQPAAEAPAVEVDSEELPPPDAGDWSAVLDEDEPEAGSEPPEDDEQPSGTEQARADYSHLDDTADHPAVGEDAAAESEDTPEVAAGPEPDLEAEPETAEPTEAPETAIFDQEGKGLGELDLELDVDDELSAEDPAAPPPAEPGFVADDPEEDVIEDQDEEEDEDLLEETPEFLQDTPEGERLWFEQGEPKDFDFEDD
ncbi:MAG: hypothetical protein WBF18_08735 [Solirubrobacterales bacterium]